MLFSIEERYIFDTCILINKWVFLPSLVVRWLGGYSKEVKKGKGLQMDRQKDKR